MAPRLDATLAGEDSTSYITLEEADRMAVNLPGGEDWIAQDLDTKALSLITATNWLETLDYVGDRCTGTQALKWPRTGDKAVCDGVAASCGMIPRRIKQAEILLAIKYVDSPASFPGGDGASNAPSGTYVKRQQLGELSIEYAQFNNNVGSSCDDCDNPQLIQSFPWLDDYLGCWVNMGPSSGAGYVLTRECCDQPPLNTYGNRAATLMDPPPYNTM